MKLTSSGLRARTASLWFVLVIVMLDVLGIGLIIPVLPALVRQFASNPQSESLWYGALATAYGLMQFLAAPALGALSDRFGRRPVLLISIFGLGLDFLLLALAPNLETLLLARVIGGLTGASFAVCSAYITDVTQGGEKRLQAFGAMGAVFGVGFVLGPALGGLLGSLDLRLPFYLASACALLNWLYGYFILPESHFPSADARFKWRMLNPFAALGDLLGMRQLSPLVWTYTLTSLGLLVLQNTLLLYSQIRFDWGPLRNGILMLLVGLCSVIMQGFLLTRLVKRWGETRTICIGLCSAIIAFCACGVVGWMWILYIAVLGNVLYFGVIPTLQSAISNQLDEARRGTALGTLQAISSVMGVIAPLLGTQLLSYATLRGVHDWRLGAPFYFAAAIQLVALVIFYVFWVKKIVGVRTAAGSMVSQ